MNRRLIANYNTTIYSGPGTNYVVYAAFLGGKTAKVVGKSEDGLWWAISVPVAPTGSGWVDAAWVTVSDADDVPVLPTPPVPPTAELVPPGPMIPRPRRLPTPTCAPVRRPIIRPTASPRQAPWAGDRQERGRSVVGGAPQSREGRRWLWLGDGAVHPGQQCREVQTIQNPDTYTVVPPAPPPSGGPTATAVEYVNVRTGPGTNYPVSGRSPPGSFG